MDNKGISKIVIVSIIVAILAVSAIAVYWTMSGNEDGTESNDNGVIDTPTTGDETEDENNGDTVDTGNEDDEETGVDVAGASSFQFKVSIDLVDADDIEYSYMVKNAETDNLMLRIEMESEGEEFIYIVNGAQQKVWIYSNDQWMDLSDAFPTYWDTWSSAWEGYRTDLLDWTGTGDWVYSTPNGDSVRIYDVVINPSLADSMFEHS